ncbi:MATE family efflux transporter [Sulfurisoma sediminicola]|uniref:Multidrug-efflux transporter n=1 Tax=Sulfurisoma sediminicola TaxID=1381557 RepID=A0A497XJR2_9PROT|nr:MATE family efflux transporter [Sulfurisoma sediminicola]RLJ68161.1 MATE family multidrug resistance protein [Sulfurisoma sediminicola]
MVEPTLIRRLFHLAWPVLIAQIAVMANAVIDTLMAGHLSAEDLAGVGIGAAIYVTVFVTLLGVLLALTPIVAHLHGAGRYAEIGEEVRQSGWLALALGLLAVVLLKNPEPLLAFSRLTPAIEAKVRLYLDAIAWSLPAALAFRVFYGFMAGIGRPRAVMAINLVGLVFKVPLNLVFIHGHFGIPAMGGPGCAAATALISWITVSIAWGWCAKRTDCEGYGVYARWSWPNLSRIGTLLRLGLPIGATQFVDVTAFTFMALFIARLGPLASASHQIASNLAVLAFMLPLALGNATAVLCGQSLGAGAPAEARHAGKLGLLLGMGMATLISGLLWLAAPAFAALYTPDPAVQAAAVPLIALVAAYHWADALQAVAVNILRGYKKTFWPMIVYAASLWGVGLAGGYVLGLTDWLGPPRGAAGFWIAATASLAVAGATVGVYFLRISRIQVAANTSTA